MTTTLILKGMTLTDGTGRPPQEHVILEACGRLAGRSDRVRYSCSIRRLVASAGMADHRAEWVGDFFNAGEGTRNPA